MRNFNVHPTAVSAERVRVEKRTRNEEIFRAANQNLKERLGRSEEIGRAPFICECSDGDCLQVVEVPLPAYEAVRAGHHFLLLPGHEDSAAELVVGDGDGYIVTEKM